MTQKNIYILIIVVAVLTTIALVLVYLPNRSEKGGERTGQEKALEDSAAEANPFNSEKSVNPFEKQPKTVNPYESIKTNPF